MFLVQKNMGQDSPYRGLEKLPPKRDKVGSIKTLRETNNVIAALAELKGIAIIWKICVLSLCFKMMKFRINMHVSKHKKQYIKH